MAQRCSFMNRAGLLLCAAVLLTGCGGGAETKSSPVTSGGGTVSAYSGPPAATQNWFLGRLGASQ